MAATISIQGAVPFAGNYQSFNVPLLKVPPEGPLTIPVSVEWATDTVSPNFSMEFQLQGQRNLQISQICALYVDNLSCDVDVVFYFPDTQFRLDVPAYSIGVFPVITNGLRFTAQCLGAVGSDQTFVQILNFNPPPVAIEKTVFQSLAAATAIAIPHTTVPTAHNIITGAGSLRGFTLFFAGLVASAGDSLTFNLTNDTGSGTGPVLYTGELTVGTTVSSQLFVSPSELALQFTQGISMYLSDGGGDITAGVVTVNLYTSP